MERNTNAGGVECYLNNLNRCILQRNKMRILQMYMASEDEPQIVVTEKVGQGEILWIPSVCKLTPISRENNIQKLWAKVKKRFVPEFRINHDLLLATLKKHPPDLAVFHWLSEDSRLIVNYLNRHSIPFVVINHFHNVRLRHRIIRSQISRAVGTAGVSNVDVPDFIKANFIDLSDGIDTNFYKPENAIIPTGQFTGPIILMPSRIVECKGHLDAVKAFGLVMRNGPASTLVFAGRVESVSLEKKLKEFIFAEGLESSVYFAGELSAVDLRTWYGACDVVVLASYSEGLGRVLLEAQAMRKVVIAYNVGGVSAAVRDGVSGYLIEKGNIETLSNRLIELLENQEKRQEMGVLGREFVIEKFSLDALIKRHEVFYQRGLGLL